MTREEEEGKGRRPVAMEAAPADLGSSDQEKRLDAGLESHHHPHPKGCSDHRGEGDSQLPVKEKDQLESARMEMGQVREENQRLKLYLDQIMRDYKTLHMQFLDIVKQGRDKTLIATIEKGENDNREIDRESELVLLSLGRARHLKKEPETIDKRSSILSQRKFNIDDAMLFEEEDQRLKLGLECIASKSNTVESTLPDSSPTGSSEEPKGEAPGESWPPGKAMKTTRGSDDEVSQQNNNPVKKARVSVRVRCDTPTMNDGCQWRKYGQKIAKGNPCPRAYYRCTVAPSCPVRKQVQRCVEDMSILITTYEGTHNHPLPMSATAMASTTSAAAQMLLSGSSSSSSSHPDRAGPSTAANLHGQNYYLSPEASRSGTMRSSQQLYFHTTSSSSSSCPTITLDLTSSNPSSSSASAHLFTRFNPSTYSSYFPILSSTSRPFSSTSTLSFNSSDSIPTALPITSWGINSSNGLLGSALGGAYTNKNRDNSSISSSIFNSYSSNPLPPQQNTALPDNIVAATKAITADPNFQSVLAAALKSIIGGENGVGPRNPSGPQ